jgi:hypothetical protein
MNCHTGVRHEMSRFDAYKPITPWAPYLLFPTTVKVLHRVAVDQQTAKQRVPGTGLTFKAYARRRQCEPGLPLLHPTSVRRFALLLGAADGMRRDRSEVPAFHSRIIERDVHRPAGPGHWSMPGAGLAAIYNVPFGGACFALEAVLGFNLVRRERSGALGIVISTLACAWVAT